MQLMITDHTTSPLQLSEAIRESISVGLLERLKRILSLHLWNKHYNKVQMECVSKCR